MVDIKKEWIEKEDWVYDSGPMKADWTFAEENYAEIETGLKAGSGISDAYSVNYAKYDTNFAAPEVSPLTLHYDPENKMLAEFTGDKHFMMYNDAGELLVDMNLTDHTMIFGDNYTPDEAAKTFWETIGKIDVNNPTNVEQEYYDTVSDEDGRILATQLTEDSEFVMSAPPGIADDMPDYSSETLSAMLDYPEETKVEVLPGGEALGELEDIQYFRDKLARAMELKQIPLVDKLEKQIALLEDSVVVYKEQRPSDIDIFDKSMEGLIDG